jgi:hypothetical protein
MDGRLHITRRHFGALTGGALASFALGIACRPGRGSEIANDGRAHGKAGWQQVFRGQALLACVFGQQQPEGCTLNTSCPSHPSATKPSL